jgi:hypothetical protein
MNYRDSRQKADFAGSSTLRITPGFEVMREDSMDWESLEDVTPHFDEVEQTTIDGRRSIIRVLVGFQGALFQKEDDGVFTDAEGVEWITGWVAGRHVRRRFHP